MQQTAQLRVALFAEVPQPLLATGTVLGGDQTQVAGQLLAVAKARRARPQAPLHPLSSFRIHHCNLLKSRMKITAYDPHVGSFLRALVLFSDNQDTWPGANLLMQSPRARRNAAECAEQPYFWR